MKILRKFLCTAIAAVMTATGLALNAAAETVSVYNENMPSDGRMSPFGKQGGQRLSGAAASFYNQEKKICQEIAAGKRTSTVFDLKISSKMSTEKFSEYWTAANNAFVYEYPELSFWMSGCEVSMSYYDESKLVSAQVTLTVTKDFAGSKANSVDSKKIKSFTDSLKNADKIVAKYKGKTGREKVEGYCSEICALTDYNDAAAGTMEGGNPWQMGWVFDGDPSTKVVCEGYAKAFYYLCKKGGVECRCVTGTMDGGVHMWNIVAVDGKTYMVDVTNMDGFTSQIDVEIEMPEAFLLRGAKDRTENGFTVTTPEKSVTYREGGSIYKYTVQSADVKYEYDSMTKGMYSKSFLTISKSDHTVHSHKGTGEYKSNSTCHWQNCGKCGGIAGMEEHTPGSDGKCTVCKN